MYLPFPVMVRLWVLKLSSALSSPRVVYASRLYFAPLNVKEKAHLGHVGLAVIKGSLDMPERPQLGTRKHQGDRQDLSVTTHGHLQPLPTQLLYL